MSRQFVSRRHRRLCAIAILVLEFSGFCAAQADQRTTMVAKRLGCRTVADVITIMRTADEAARQGADLSAARAALQPRLDAGTCKDIPAGTPVTVVAHDDRESFPFVCLKTDGDAGCLWVSSFDVRMP